MDYRTQVHAFGPLTPLEETLRALNIAGPVTLQPAPAWHRPHLSSVILGARDSSQLETNLRAVTLRLTAAETAALDAASDPRPVDYPYGEMGQEQRSRELAGGRLTNIFITYCGASLRPAHVAMGAVSELAVRAGLAA